MNAPLIVGGLVALIVWLIVVESLSKSLPLTLVYTEIETVKFPNFVGLPKYLPLLSIPNPGGTPSAFQATLGSLGLT